MPFYLSYNNMTSFQHLWDYEPAPYNDWIPKYGVFSYAYMQQMMSANMKETEKFTSFKKTVGPPNYWYPVEYDPLDKNEYLLSKEVDVEKIKSRNTGKALVELHH